ncbi:mechanosensitive ion channel family protein [Candidatus Woesearchaeota archaeon]|nr:mechanosensitive ion channel family protein [Candidatus Woesearchaeota archaeon]
MAFLTETYFGNTVMQYLVFLLILAGGILAGRAAHWVATTILAQAAKKTKTNLDDILIKELKRPIVFLLFILSAYYGITFLALSERAAEIFSNVLQMLIILDITWFLIAFVDSILIHYVQPLTEKTKSDLDEHLLPILRKLVKIILIVIALIMIISEFGYDVTSLLAGLGLGGLAFALAAQDLLKNLFGGVAILTDKPFKLGQRIKVDEKYDGFVREIGMRTTRIETFDGTQLILPNSKIADSIVENISAERARRVKLVLGVTYGTSSAKLERAQRILADIVKRNRNTEDESRVWFSGFGDFALQLTLIYWIRDLDNIITAQGEINTAIKKGFEKARIDFAFPTQTIELVRKG